jgi:glutamate-1-semialdehyde 2,1-aminomutase
VAGAADIMRHFDPALEGTPQYVQQAGTLNGNPIAAVAGLATLRELRKPRAYERLHALGARLRDGLAAAARRRGIAAQVSGEPPVFDILFTDRPIVDYRATLTADRDRMRIFNEACVRHGLIKAVNKIYVSLAHTEADVIEALGIFEDALGAVAERSGRPS